MPRSGRRAPHSGNGLQPCRCPPLVIRLIVDKAARLLRRRPLHCGGHSPLHSGMLIGLAVDHAADLVFAFGNDDVSLDRLRLAETPASAHGLIPSLVGEGTTDES